MGWSGRAPAPPAVSWQGERSTLLDNTAIAVIGIDIGKNSFHIVGLDGRGTIVLCQKWSRSQVETRFANMSPCLIGMGPASAPIISVASSRRWGTMPG